MPIGSRPVVVAARAGSEADCLCAVMNYRCHQGSVRHDWTSFKTAILLGAFFWHTAVLCVDATAPAARIAAVNDCTDLILSDGRSWVSDRGHSCSEIKPEMCATEHGKSLSAKAACCRCNGGKCFLAHCSRVILIAVFLITFLSLPPPLLRLLRFYLPCSLIHAC